MGGSLSLNERLRGDRGTNGDRRVKLLSLTPEGTAMRDRISREVSENALVLHRLGDSQVAALRPLLETMFDGSSPQINC